MIVPAAFILASLAVLWLSLATRRGRWDAVILASGLALSCIGTNALGYAAIGWDGVRMLYPLIDFALLGLASWLFWTDPKAWKVALIFALLNKMIAHAVFWAAQGWWSAHDYVLCCNIIFAEELIVVATPGGISVGRHLLHIADRGGVPGWACAARRHIEIEARRVSQAAKDR